MRGKKIRSTLALEDIFSSARERTLLFCLRGAPGCACVQLWEQTTWWHVLNRGPSPLGTP